MAHQWKNRKLDHRNGFIAREEKKVKYPEKSIIEPRHNNKKGNYMADIVGYMDPTTTRNLSLCSKQLTYLSDEVSLYLNLVHLDVSDNKLESLPSSLQHLACLRSLMLHKNRLRILPSSVMKIPNLRVLNLSKNEIQSLPDNFGDLKSLESLNLSSNFLKALPDSCENLNRLKYLNLNTNSFSKLPDCIVRGMRALETLDVSINLYINIAMAPATKILKHLYIRDCGPAVKFPLWLLKGKAPHLQVLGCDGTKFKSFAFPDNCRSLKLQILSMQSCSVYDKFMQDITTHTDELTILRVGNACWTNHNNAFWKIPILNLKRPRLMTEISVRGTALTDVCREIGNFVNLVKLDLGDNRINWLPDEICQLNKLNVLLVDENQLSSLPENIGKMTSLKELKANKNNISSLPGSIKDLKQLTYLDLYENEFQEVPEALKHIKSLLGVDLDFNNFESHDLSIGDLKYETLRSNLRKLYLKDGCHRYIGPRYESESEELSDSRSVTSSERDEPEITVPENNTNNEPNWDASDDSADEMEFNCEVTVESKPETISFISMLSDRFSFCPADLHEIPVRQQVELKKQRGEIKDDFEVVEGQFDDVY